MVKDGKKTTSQGINSQQKQIAIATEKG